MKRFDELFNMAEGQGKGFVDLPYNLRANLYQGLSKEELKQFQLGRADAELLKKAQPIYDTWFNETHPTEETKWNRRREAETRSRVSTLEIQLKTAKRQLEHWNTVFKNDGHVPYGERARLQKEIAGIERDLLVNKSLTETNSKTDNETTEEDWFDGLI